MDLKSKISILMYKILRQILVLMFFFLLGQMVYAQEGRLLDELHLKNGKVVKGIIQKKELGVVTITLMDSIANEEKTQMYQQNDISKIISRTKAEQALRSDSVKSNLETSRTLPQIKKNVSAKNTPVSDISKDLLPDEQEQKATLTPMPLPNTKLVEVPMPMQGPTVAEGEMLAAPIDPAELNKAPKPRRRYIGWYRQIRGFRMFLDYGYIVGIGNTKNNKMEFATSLGYQFNPIFYVGAGTGGQLSMNDKDHSLPVFINGRMNFLDEYTTPFLDVRTGYSVAEGKGFYFSASAGVSFTKKGKHAFNLGLTYTSQNVKYYEWRKGERIPIREAQHGLGLRASFEF